MRTWTYTFAFAGFAVLMATAINIQRTRKAESGGGFPF